MIPRRLFVTAAMVGFSLFGDSMLYAVLPAEAAGLGLAASAVGWLLSLNRWVRLITNPVAARVSAHLGWRGPFLAAVVLGGLTTTAYYFVESLWILLAARAVWGLCWSFLRHGSFEAVIETSTAQTRGRNMGFLTGIFRIGSLIGMLLGGLLTDTIGFRMAVLLFGIGTVAGLGVAAWDGWFAGGWPRRPVDARPAAAHSLLWSALKSPAWLGTSLCGLLIHLTTSGVVTATLGYYLRERLPDGWQLGSVLIGVATLSGALLSLRWVSGIALNPLMGHLSDRFGRPRLMALGAVTGALSLSALAMAPSVGLIAAAVLAVWIAESAMVPALDATAADLANREGAEAMGLYASGVDLGAALGPLVGYYLLQGGVPLTQVYSSGAGTLLLIIVLYQGLVVNRTRMREEKA